MVAILSSGGGLPIGYPDMCRKTASIAVAGDQVRVCGKRSRRSWRPAASRFCYILTEPTSLRPPVSPLEHQ